MNEKRPRAANEITLEPGLGGATPGLTEKRRPGRPPFLRRPLYDVRVKVDEKLHTWLHEYAEHHGITPSEAVRRILDDAAALSPIDYAEEAAQAKTYNHFALEALAEMAKKITPNEEIERQPKLPPIVFGPDYVEPKDDDDEDDELPY